MFPLPLIYQQLIVLLVTFSVVVLLVSDRVRPSYVFGGAILLFLVTGIVDSEDFLKSFSNKSVITIFLLIFITAGIKENFNLIGWLNSLFGSSKSGKLFMLKMTTAVAAVSSIANNTPIVALMIPYVYQWAKKNKVPPSKLLMPLSFAAIMGGMTTLIGTATNLVLNGFILAKGEPGLGFEDFLYLGLLITASGLAYLYFFGYKGLPVRTNVLEELNSQTREYLVETKVNRKSKLVGQTVLDAKLRNLKGIYLFEIVRAGKAISPVSPKEVIGKEDILFFAGDTENILELVKNGHGLELPLSYGNMNGNLNLVETVVPANSMLIGATLKEINFRENYDGAAVAIHRNGEKLRGKVGEISMKAGDLLLISAGDHFERTINKNKDLYLVSQLVKTVEHPMWKKKAFGLWVVLSISGIIMGVISLFVGLILILSCLLCLKLISLKDVQKSFDFDLLLILAASLTFSKALIDTGSAQIVADSFMSVFGNWGDKGLLIGVFLLTLLLASVVTHVAAVSIAFPITYALCLDLNMVALPFYVAIAFAASASFHAPFSYQTNLMVYGPGGYKYQDFLKVGLPFTTIYSLICLGFIIWFYGV